MTDVDFGQYPVETLARWYCELNCFHWPDDFPAPKPDGWDGLTGKQIYTLGLGRPYFDAVRAAVPEAARHAYWQGPFQCGKALFRRGPEPTESWRNRPPLL